MGATHAGCTLSWHALRSEQHADAKYFANDRDYNYRARSALTLAAPPPYTHIAYSLFEMALSRVSCVNRSHTVTFTDLLHEPNVTRRRERVANEEGELLIGECAYPDATGTWYTQASSHFTRSRPHPLCCCCCCSPLSLSPGRDLPAPALDTRSLSASGRFHLWVATIGGLSHGMTSRALAHRWLGTRGASTRTGRLRWMHRACCCPCISTTRTSCLHPPPSPSHSQPREGLYSASQARPTARTSTSWLSSMGIRSRSAMGSTSARASPSRQSSQSWYAVVDMFKSPSHPSRFRSPISLTSLLLATARAPRTRFVLHVPVAV